MLKYKLSEVVSVMMDVGTVDFIKNTYRDLRYKINPTAYFYDLAIIEENISKLRNYMPKEISLYYAMKANVNDSILKYIASNDYIKGFEIASSGEIDIASNYLSTNRLIFTGPGKTEYELLQAIKNKIRFINIESVVEAIRIQRLAQEYNIDNVDVLIRINLNYSLAEGMENMSGCSTKMGIDEDDFVSSFKIINELDRITVKGIHVFASSGVLDYKALLKSNRYIFDLVKKIEPLTKVLEVIDFGGGLGIDYTNQNRIFDALN